MERRKCYGLFIKPKTEGIEHNFPYVTFTEPPDADGWLRYPNVKEFTHDPKTLHDHHARHPETLFQWREVPDTEWMEREVHRMRNEYLRLPHSWGKFVWDPKHYYENEQHQVTMRHGRSLGNRFLHISTKQKGLVAFTESQDKGARDIQKVMKPGRYLAQYHPELSMEEVRKLCADVENAIERNGLKIARTAQECVDVYTHGPSSCMDQRHEFDFNYDYVGFNNPACVYGDCDFGVAYVGDPKGIVEARCVVVPDKKIHGRIYGHVEKLKLLLKKAGYQDAYKDHNTLWEGSRLSLRYANKKHKHIVMPYVDIMPWGVYSKDDEGEWIRIISDRDGGNGTVMCLQHTDAMIEFKDNKPRCPFTGELITPKTVMITVNDYDQPVPKKGAMARGYIFTADRVWAQNYDKVFCGEGQPMVMYSHDYIRNHEEMFIRCEVWGRVYLRDKYQECKLYRDLYHTYSTTDEFMKEYMTHYKHVVKYKSNYYYNLGLLQQLHPEANPSPNHPILRRTAGASRMAKELRDEGDRQAAVNAYQQNPNIFATPTNQTIWSDPFAPNPYANAPAPIRRRG